MATPNAQWLGKWRDRVLSPDGPKDPGAKLVALGVAKFVNVRTLSTYVGAEKLGTVTGLSERTVRKHLQDLTATDWITAQSKSRGRDWNLRCYRLQLPAHAPEEIAGAHDNTDAPEVIARAPEENDASTGSFCIEHRKKLPTNSEIFNTKKEHVFLTREFPIEKRLEKDSVPMPKELQGIIQERRVLREGADLQRRIENAAKLVRAVPSTEDSHIAKMYQISPEQIRTARTVV